MLLCGKPYTEMIAVMAWYNPFAEHVGMIRVGESQPDRSILETIEKLEQIGFTAYLLALPEYNKKKLENKILHVKAIIGNFNYPYNRRIAGQHERFKKDDYANWPLCAQEPKLAQALTHLARSTNQKST